MSRPSYDAEKMAEAICTGVAWNISQAGCPDQKIHEDRRRFRNEEVRYRNREFREFIHGWSQYVKDSAIFAKIKEERKKRAEMGFYVPPIYKRIIRTRTIVRR